MSFTKPLPVLALLPVAFIVIETTHVLGHALAALACGCRLENITLFGLQLHPGLAFTGFRLVSWAGYSQPTTAWCEGFIRVMGSGFNVFIATVSVALLVLLRPHGLPRIILCYLSLFTLDIAVYTIHPFLNLLPWRVLEYPEAMYGASQIGIPAGAFATGMIAVFVATFSLAAWQMRLPT